MTNLSHFPKIFKKQLRHLTKPRRSGARVFGLGASKTGTHTLGEMFESHIRGGHEADANRLIRLILNKVDTGNPRPLHRFLKFRDIVRNLKIDSSSVNTYLLDDWLSLYPDSRFILTVRAPGSWLRSMVDHSVLRDPTPEWKRFRTYRFGANSGHPPEETALAEAGLYPLAAYLDYWRVSVSSAYEKVPEQQLLVVPTNKIGEMPNEIAAFCGIDTIRAPNTTHSYANRHRAGLLEGIDSDYVTALIEREVGGVARRALPGWAAENDVKNLG
jgi:hypothetical protein